MNYGNTAIVSMNGKKLLISENLAVIFYAECTGNIEIIVINNKLHRLKLCIFDIKYTNKFEMWAKMVKKS